VINTEQNQGLPYAYDEVVRKKDERKGLTGSSCEQCKEVCAFLILFNTRVDNLYGSSGTRTSLHYLHGLRARAGVHVLLTMMKQHLFNLATTITRVKADRVRLRSINNESLITARPGLPLRTRQTIGQSLL
jgi:hypothetical protein